jgi:hypothetical protein
MVDVRIGQQYSGGTRVNFPSIGVSFVVPDEWIGQIPPGAEAFVMGSHIRQGLIIAMSHRASQLDQLAQEFQQPVPLDQGVVLHLQQPAQVSDPQLSALISVSDGLNNLPGYLVALARDGGGGVVFAGFGPEPLEYYQTLVGALASSFQETPGETVTAPPSSGRDSAGEAASQVREWDQFLRGKKLTYLHSYSSNTPGGGGFSTQIEYYLCRDGRFRYGGSDSLSGGDFAAFPGGGSSSSGQGRWKIISEGPTIGIKFSWDDGRVTASRLEYIDSKT